ncbi:hypothetical protein J6590_050008 [Homalodisca vitripennis]|nr:hypothetical protein J6590_050008 [Homalodisca vitripennis]
MADSIVIGVQTGVREQLPATKQFTVYLLRPADSCNWTIWSSQLEPPHYQTDKTDQDKAVVSLSSSVQQR